jgi:hypothetical protein
MPVFKMLNQGMGEVIRNLLTCHYLVRLCLHILF